MFLLSYEFRQFQIWRFLLDNLVNLRNFRLTCKDWNNWVEEDMKLWEYLLERNHNIEMKGATFDKFIKYHKMEYTIIPQVLFDSGFNEEKLMIQMQSKSIEIDKKGDTVDRTWRIFSQSHYTHTDNTIYYINRKACGLKINGKFGMYEYYLRDCIGFLDLHQFHVYKLPKNLDMKIEGKLSNQYLLREYFNYLVQWLPDGIHFIHLAQYDLNTKILEKFTDMKINGNRINFEKSIKDGLHCIIMRNFDYEYEKIHKSYKRENVVSTGYIPVVPQYSYLPYTKLCIISQHDPFNQTDNFYLALLKGDEAYKLYMKKINEKSNDGIIMSYDLNNFNESHVKTFFQYKISIVIYSDH